MDLTTGKVDNVELWKFGLMHWKFLLSVEAELLGQMVYGYASVIIRGSE